MKICRFNDNRLGLVEAGEVLDVTEALDVLPALRYPFPVSDQLITHLPELRARIETLMPNAKRLPLAQVRLLAPVANPGKIIAAPVNYVKHLKEVLADPNLHHDNQIILFSSVARLQNATNVDCMRVTS